MGVEKRSEGGKQIKEVVTFRYCLGSGEQKCLKAKYGVIRRGRQDKAKNKYKKCKKPEKPKKQDIIIVGTKKYYIKRVSVYS